MHKVNIKYLNGLEVIVVVVVVVVVVAVATVVGGCIVYDLTKRFDQLIKSLGKTEIYCAAKNGTKW